MAMLKVLQTPQLKVLFPITAEEGEAPTLSRCSGGGEDVFLTPGEAAAYLRVSKSYLDKLRVYGGGPNFLRFGKRSVARLDNHGARSMRPT